MSYTIHITGPDYDETIHMTAGTTLTVMVPGGTPTEISNYEMLQETQQRLMRSQQENMELRERLGEVYG